MSTQQQQLLLMFLEDEQFLSFVETALGNSNHDAADRVPDSFDVEEDEDGNEDEEHVLQDVSSSSGLYFDAEHGELFAEVPVDLILLLDHSPELGNLCLTNNLLFNKLLSQSLTYAADRLQWTHVNAVFATAKVGSWPLADSAGTTTKSSSPTKDMNTTLVSFHGSVIGISPPDSYIHVDRRACPQLCTLHCIRIAELLHIMHRAERVRLLRGKAAEVYVRGLALHFHPCPCMSFASCFCLSLSLQKLTHARTHAPRTHAKRSTNDTTTISSTRPRKGD